MLIFGGHLSFSGATDTLDLDFWFLDLKASRQPYSHLAEMYMMYVPSDSSGLTPADLLVASMAAESFSSTYLQTRYIVPLPHNLMFVVCLLLCGAHDGLVCVAVKSDNGPRVSYPAC